MAGFSFAVGELTWLADSQGFQDQDLAALQELRFTGEVWAVPEGTAVFAGEPLGEVTAPAAEAQLAETVLLGQVTVQTSIATKAPVRAAGRVAASATASRRLGSPMRACRSSNAVTIRTPSSRGGHGGH